MSAAAGKTYNFAFSENDMVGYYDHNGAMVRDDVDRSIFRIAGFENISWPRGGSGSTVTWTKVRLSCAIYSFDPSRLLRVSKTLIEIPVLVAYRATSEMSSLQRQSRQLPQ